MTEPIRGRIIVDSSDDDSDSLSMLQNQNEENIKRDLPNDEYDSDGNLVVIDYKDTLENQKLTKNEQLHYQSLALKEIRGFNYVLTDI